MMFRGSGWSNVAERLDAKKLEEAKDKLKAKHERRTEKEGDSSDKDNRVDSSRKCRCYAILTENFDASFEEWPLLQGAELYLASGRCYSLVGRDGLGKTMLLDMLASQSLQVPAHISILIVEFEVADDDTPTLQTVLDSNAVRMDLMSDEWQLNACITNAT